MPNSLSTMGVDAHLHPGSFLALPIAAAAWLDHLRSLGYAPSTVAAYDYRLRQLMNCLDEITMPMISGAVLTHCLEQLQGLSGGSRNSLQYAWRSFFKWLYQVGMMPTDPSRDLKPVRYSAAPYPPITLGEIDTLLTAIHESKEKKSIRDEALFGIYAFTGIRRSEALSLTIADYLVRDGSLRVKSKGGRVRDVPVIERLRQILGRYLLMLAGEARMANQFLFPGQGRNSLSSRQSDRLFLIWRHKAGLRRGLSVHSFRSGLATNLYLATKDLLLVGKALGHVNLQTTARYISRTLDLRPYLEELFAVLSSTDIQRAGA